MSPSQSGDLGHNIINALTELLNLRVPGETIREIWSALDLDSSLEDLLLSIAENARLTLRDGESHKSAVELRTEVPVAVSFAAWPRSFAEGRHEARDYFLNAAEFILKEREVLGLVQFDLFLPPGQGAEMRIAWLPAGTGENLPPALRSPLFPWGGGIAAPAPVAQPAPTGSDLVELAAAAWELHTAMGERLRLWPGEGRPPALDFDQFRARFSEHVLRFNAAAARLDLAHTMPVSRFDETWLPHNLANEQRFGSLAASLRADLARVWGADAREVFGRVWELFAKTHPVCPREQDLQPFAGATLERRGRARAESAPRQCDVFISYAWSDKTRGARDIYEFIRGFHPAVWLDEEEHPRDERLNQEIAAAMFQAAAVVICVSREMLTRGGYALREVLLALSKIPERCLVVRLDRIPAPSTLGSLRSVAWFDRDGSGQLQAALTAMLEDAPRNAAPADLSLGGPIVDALIGSLRRPSSAPRREIHDRGRGRRVLLRARLVDLAHEVLDLANAGKYQEIVDLTAQSADVLDWSTLHGEPVKADATILLPALRTRSGLFRAHVQLGSGDRFELHNSAAFELLDELVEIDLDLLLPERRLGVLPQDCRIAVQDCLDSFDFAEDWFRGWSPKTLVRYALAPAGRGATIVRRMEQRGDRLAERMFALRALEESMESPDPAPSWSDIWRTVSDHLHEVRSGSHPHTVQFLKALSKVMSGVPRSAIAVALADGVIECFFDREYREELFFDVANFRLRSIVRCYRCETPKHEALASVRGTVFPDLLGPQAEEADLNVLYSFFLAPVTADGGLRYELYLNSLATPDRAGALPPILRNPFVTAEMLSDDERARMTGGPYQPIYDELD